MVEKISEHVEQIKKRIIAWRREFHQYPEVGWTEFRTASIVANTLADLGFVVQTGRAAVKPEQRLGVPDTTLLSKAKERALQNGGSPLWLNKMEEGLTGVVGIWDTGKPGPTVAFRFDMDALEITKDLRAEHGPALEGFRSRHEGVMHACGHDGHTAIGLGLATLVSGLKERLTGRIKLIFQPAEEGGRGAKAMVDAGVLDDVDFFFAGHLGLMARQNNQVVCGVTTFRLERMKERIKDINQIGIVSETGGVTRPGFTAAESAAHRLICSSFAGNQRVAIKQYACGNTILRLAGDGSRSAILSCVRVESAIIRKKESMKKAGKKERSFCCAPF